LTAYLDLADTVGKPQACALDGEPELRLTAVRSLMPGMVESSPSTISVTSRSTTSGETLPPVRLYSTSTLRNLLSIPAGSSSTGMRLVLMIPSTPMASSSTITVIGLRVKNARIGWRSRACAGVNSSDMVSSLYE
jgi:hypothetical protein